MSMTDAAHKAQVKRLEDVREKWMPLLPVFDLWTIRHDLYSDDEGLTHKKTKTAAIAAEAETLWPYLRASIAWDTSAMKGLSDSDLEFYFMHELMHVLLAELADKKRTPDSEERTATILAKALIFLRTTCLEEAAPSAT